MSPVSDATRAERKLDSVISSVDHYLQARDRLIVELHAEHGRLLRAIHDCHLLVRPAPLAPQRVRCSRSRARARPGSSPLPHREIRVLDQAHLEEVVELDGRGHTQRGAQGRAIHTEGRAIGNVSALSFARLAPQF
jgi:hypothetical protein